MGIQEWGEAAFRTIDALRRRKFDYQQTFLSVSGQRALVDLARFCRANETCFHSDPRLHAVAEGRREVWLRIQQHLNLTSEELFELYQGITPLKPGESK